MYGKENRAGRKEKALHLEKQKASFGIQGLPS
jgi:hypothetical protein